MQKNIILLSAALTTLVGVHAKDKTATNKKQPNVILIITDDQGYGDLGFTGNHIVRTPNIDRLAAEGITLSDFSVSPVSAPTRSSLMTGRESLRTGICDTYNGGTTMSTNEVTIAEVLKKAGYSTAIFGKWHLGDNYPCRAIDQGFDEALTHGGGGIGQPGDFFNYHKGDSSYFNPVLWHNGEPKKTEGYCTDVFGNAAVDYIEKSNNNSPFFMYLSFNAPHTPLQLPQQYYDMYKDCDPTTGFGSAFMPKMNESSVDAARKVYGMVTNIDDNIGKVITALKKKGIDNNTLIIFLTDNGPEQTRYVGGFSRTKGSVYQGGVRVPCVMHMPSKLGNAKVAYPSAHIDMLPTIASICNVSIPDTLKLDGENILPKIEGRVNNGNRTFFHWWTRQAPMLYRNMAVRSGDYKLVGKTTKDAPITNFELYNIKTDIAEQHNIVHDNISLANSLKSKMDSWYKDVIASDNLYNNPAIIGTENENPVYLNRNDALGQEAIWTTENVYGYWDIDIAKSGNYDITCAFINPLSEEGKLKIKIGNVLTETTNNQIGVSEITIKDVYLPKGRGICKPWYFSNAKNGKYNHTLPLYVKITRK